jgi:hypothetical protein
LGSVGLLDLPRVAHKLDVLSSISNFEPLEPICETDLKGFHNNQRENGILSVTLKTRRMVCFFSVATIYRKLIVSDLLIFLEF